MKVSVMIPFYRDLSCLPETLEGLRAQTCQDFEMILVADGSGTEIVREAESLVFKAFPDRRRFRMLSCKTNQGPGYARNYGIQYGARGDYIMVQDSDDVSFPRRVEMSIRALDAGADLFYGDAIRGTCVSKGRHLRCKSPEKITLDNWLMMNETWFGIMHGTTAYRRKLALLYPYPVYARGYGEDTQFLMMLGLFAGIRLAYAAEPVLFIRTLQSSLSNAKLAVDTRQKRLRLCGDYFGHYYRLGIKSQGAGSDRLAVPAAGESPKTSKRVILVTALKRFWDYYQPKKWKGMLCRFSKVL